MSGAPVPPAAAHAVAERPSPRRGPPPLWAAAVAWAACLALWALVADRAIVAAAWVVSTAIGAWVLRSRARVGARRRRDRLGLEAALAAEGIAVGSRSFRDDERGGVGAWVVGILLFVFLLLIIAALTGIPVWLLPRP